VDTGLYSTQSSDRTYERLRALARTIVESGYPVIVDGTFIERERRRSFRDLAAALGVPFLILHCRAPQEVLVQRIVDRLESRTDASEADLDVLRAQRRREQAVEPAECFELIDIESDDSASVEAAVERLVQLADSD